MRILVRRTGALGDVVLATPIVRRLKRENPDVEIVVQTAYPDVFKGNPHVADVVLPSLKVPPEPIWRHVDLDLAYERRPRMHIVEAYMREAFGEDDEVHSHVWTQEMFFDRTPLFAKPNRRVAVHAAWAGGVTARFPARRGRRRSSGLPRRGCGRSWSAPSATTCRVPLSADVHPGHSRADAADRLVRLFRRFRLRTAARRRCHRHAGRRDIHLRESGLSDDGAPGNFAVVTSRYLDCLGCLHRPRRLSRPSSCERGDIACVGMVHADDIVHEVVRMAESKRPG